MQNIDIQSLKQKLDRNEDFVFLNVLPEKEYEKEHIPGSGNIPYNDDRFLDKVAEKAADKNEEIVVYCADEECPASGKAARQLEEACYTDVKDFEGGMKAWKDADYAVAA